MRKFWIIISVCWLWTCGGGGGGSSPTEPQEPAPVANFTATPTTLIQGQAVTFTSTSTGTITSYAWNVDNDPAIEGTTATYEHPYTEVGTYSITLTVTGPGGSNPKTVADMITVSTAAPTPTTSTSQTVQEDGSTTISLTATDPNGQAVTFAITTDPTNGTATLSGTDITYTPNANFYGTDSFDYTASNGTYTSDPATITITVEGEDDGDPTTNDVSATTDEDTVVTVNLDATEIDGDNYSFNIISQPTNGTLGSVNGNQVEYTPNQDFNGTDTFTFEATDDRTYRRNVATATITINAVNDAPVANDITSQVTDENRLMQLDITLDATDVEGDALTYSVVGTNNGTVTVNGSTATYIPNQDWNGEDTFTYKANDGTDDSNTATVTVTVNAVNDAPVTQNVSFTTDEDTPYTESYTGYVSDVDGDDLTIIGVTNPTFGTATCEGTDCTYTPYQDVHGTDSFTYKVNDGELDSNISTVSVTINPVNDAPVANDVTASTTSRTGNMRQSVDINLSVTDADGDDLTISIVSDVSNGTTSLSGSTVTYTPPANYDGTDTFTYKANDGTVDSNIATGTITITDTNQAPIANDMSLSLDRESSIDFTLDATDEDGDSLSKTIVSQPENGSLIPAPGLDFTYNPSRAYYGSDSFTYKVNDGNNDSEEKTVTFDIDQVVIDYDGLASISSNSGYRYKNIARSFDNHNFIIIDDTNSSDSILKVDDSANLVTTLQVDSKNKIKKISNGFIFYSGSLDGGRPCSNSFEVYDSNLSLILQYNDSSFCIRDVIELRDGSFVAVGDNRNNASGGYKDSIIKKINQNGDVIWAYTENLNNISTGGTGAVTTTELDNGDIIFTVENLATGVIKTASLNASGQSLNWVVSKDICCQVREQLTINNITYVLYSKGSFIAFDQNGNDVMSSSSNYFRTWDLFYHSSNHIFITGRQGVDDKLQEISKFDLSGNLIWEKTYTMPAYNTSWGAGVFYLDLVELSNGNIMVLVKHDYRHNGGVFIIDENNGDRLLP